MNIKINSKEFNNIEKDFLEKNNLIKITSQAGLLIDYVPYATSKNFCQTQLYSHPFLYLHQDAFKSLQLALELSKQKNFKIKIWDAFRPFKVQSYMADNFPDFVKGGFVSHPKKGIATHIRGIAVDLTLTDINDNELDMGTEFDAMLEESHHDSTKISELAKKNRQILKQIMTDSGFEIYSEEWWHYNLKIFNYDSNNKINGAIKEQDKKYPKIIECPDVLLSEIVKNYYQTNF